MFKVIKFILFTVILMSNVHLLNAEELTDIDQNSVKLRVPDTQAVQELINKPEFDYEDNDTDFIKELQNRIIAKIYELYHKYFPDVPKDSFVRAVSIIQWILIALGSIILAIILFFVIKYIVKVKNRNKKNKFDIENLFDASNVNEIDLNKLLDDALNNKNFKYALQLYYFKTLKYLDKYKIIKIKKYKTDYEYVREISDAKIKNLFSNLALKYQKIIFGDYPLGDFSVLERDFKKLLSMEITNEK